MQDHKHEKNFEQIFIFLEYLYRGNWQYRWGQVPFMSYGLGGEKVESILAHQWSCMALWSLLSPVLQETSKVVDSQKVCEYLLFHDIGEICVGDTPIIQQMKEGFSRKRELESREIDIHTENLPPVLQNLIRSYYQDYTFIEPPTIEVSLARYINAIQGNHFGLVYGQNLVEYSDLISQIVATYFVPVDNMLRKILSSQNAKAVQEIDSLTNYHLQSIRSRGIKLSLTQEQ